MNEIEVEPLMLQEVEETVEGLRRNNPVSYTHLDVYKRQVSNIFSHASLNCRGRKVYCLLYTSICV